MKKMLLFVLIIPWSAASSQAVKLVEGGLQPLQDQTSIIVIFDYDGVRIGKDGEFAEADYVQRRKNEYNDKQAGRGDQWEKNWYDSREAVLEPKFNLLLEKYGKIKVTSTEAKYTLIFKTTRIDPGWSLGLAVGALSLMRESAKIDAEVFIVDTNSNDLIARLIITNISGHPGESKSDSAYILSESYAKSGKEIGRMIAKIKSVRSVD